MRLNWLSRVTWVGPDRYRTPGQMAQGWDKGRQLKRKEKIPVQGDVLCTSGSHEKQRRESAMGRPMGLGKTQRTLSEQAEEEERGDMVSPGFGSYFH